MPRIMIIASFDQRIGPVGYPFTNQCDLMLEPTNVTLGFRQVFRKCVSATHYETGLNVPLHWLRRDFMLEEIYLFESVGTSLCETEGDIFVLGVVLTIERLDTMTISKLRIHSGLDEQEAIYALIDALPQAMRDGITGQVQHSKRLPGLSSFTFDEDHIKLGRTAPMLFCFFYFAKLLLWRIRRDQAEISISLLQRNFREAIFSTAVQRSRIINIKRFQLTSNVSNSPVVQHLAAELRTKLNLQREYDNDEQLNTLVEEYLASLEKLFNEESRRRVDLGMAVFSFVAVPFTVFAAFLTMIGLPQTLDIVRSSMDRSFSFGIWLLVIVSIAIPSLIYLGMSLTRHRDPISGRIQTIRGRVNPSKSGARWGLRRLWPFGTRSH